MHLNTFNKNENLIKLYNKLDKVFKCKSTIDDEINNVVEKIKTYELFKIKFYKAFNSKKQLL